MDSTKERRVGVESARQLLWNELNVRLDHCSIAKDDKLKGVRDTIKENAIKLKEKELEERQNMLDAKDKMLEKRRLELDLKENDLVIMEKNIHSEVEKMKREHQVHLREKNLGKNIEEEVEEKIIQVDTIEGKPIRSDSTDRTRKRGRLLLEMGESSTMPQVSGAGRDVQRQDGSSFLLTIMQTHEDRNAMTVPAQFVAAYDLSGKKYVILSTEEGNFRLMVKHYDDSRQDTSNHVVFRRGWSYFYEKNRLSIGMQCLFKVKEHAVNGDNSVFSMEVTVLGR